VRVGGKVRLKKEDCEEAEKWSCRPCFLEEFQGAAKRPKVSNISNILGQRAVTLATVKGWGYSRPKSGNICHQGYCQGLKVPVPETCLRAGAACCCHLLLPLSAAGHQGLQ
jgi:hypothetical protein